MSLISVSLGIRFERWKVDNHANLHEKWNMQTLSLWIFQPNIIKIDPYNFSFFLRHSVVSNVNKTLLGSKTKTFCSKTNWNQNAIFDDENHAAEKTSACLTSYLLRCAGCGTCYCQRPINCLLQKDFPPSVNCEIFYPSWHKACQNTNHTDKQTEHQVSNTITTCLLYTSDAADE